MVQRRLDYGVWPRLFHRPNRQNTTAIPHGRSRQGRLPDQLTKRIFVDWLIRGASSEQVVVQAQLDAPRDHGQSRRVQWGDKRLTVLSDRERECPGLQVKHIEPCPGPPWTEGQGEAEPGS